MRSITLTKLVVKPYTDSTLRASVKHSKFSKDTLKGKIIFKDTYLHYKDLPYLTYKITKENKITFQLYNRDSKTRIATLTFYCSDIVDENIAMLNEFYHDANFAYAVANSLYKAHPTVFNHYINLT